jgi:triosephosphate isomerase
MILAANFKTCHTHSITKNYLSILNDFIKQNDIKDEIYIFPPSTALNQDKQNYIKLGAQNAYPVKNGAYTGEIGYEQLEDCNIDTILIGHSERRAIGDNDKLLKEKFDFFCKKNMNIIYCIGESLDIKNSGSNNKEEFLKNQLSIIDNSYDKLVIAYEPIWAIGTGVVATVDEIQKTHTFLKTIVKKPLLYGGSVKPNNIKEILEISDVDGVLVGSASLKVDDFKEMLTISKSLDK